MRYQGKDWGDEDYEDYDDEYLYNGARGAGSGAGGRVERTMSRNGSDEMSAGSGPSHAPGRYNTSKPLLIALPSYTEYRSSKHSE